MLSSAYGGFLARVGRASEGLVYLEQARRAEPLDSSIAWFLSEAYASSGNVKAALAELDRVLNLEADPGEEPAIRSLLREAGLWAALAAGDDELIDQWLDQAIEDGVARISLETEPYQESLIVRLGTERETLRGLVMKARQKNLKSDSDNSFPFSSITFLNRTR